MNPAVLDANPATFTSMIDTLLRWIRRTSRARDSYRIACTASCCYEKARGQEMARPSRAMFRDAFELGWNLRSAMDER
jgi:hypothetical protein